MDHGRCGSCHAGGKVGGQKGGGSKPRPLHVFVEDAESLHGIECGLFGKLGFFVVHQHLLLVAAEDGVDVGLPEESGHVSHGELGPAVHAGR